MQRTATAPPPVLSQRASWAAGGAISFLMRQGVENRECLSLAAGLVDPSTLPVGLVRETVAELLAGPDAAGLLQYGHTAGAANARMAVLEHFASLEGVPTGELAATRGLTAGRVVLTTGSQQFLSLVCQILLDPGDICLVAGPTYFCMLGTIAGVGGRAVRLETDEHGVTPDGLNAALDRFDAAGELDRVKLLYLVPDFENPSGVTLAGGRRAAILDLLARRDPRVRIRVLEDAAYREMRFEGDNEGSLWGRDADDRVIYAGTFSKTLSPGLRVGFGVLPLELVQPVIDRKGNEDFGSACLNQHVLARVLETGAYAPHLAAVRASYRAKRDALLAGLEEHLGGVDGANWLTPAGGLYVWFTAPCDTGFDSPLWERATKAEGVMYVPGEICFAPESADGSSIPTRHARLAYGVLGEGELHEAAARLGRAVRAVA